VDWDKTKAFAMGLGCIFLNRKGREANGIVSDGDVEMFRQDRKRINWFGGSGS